MYAPRGPAMTHGSALQPLPAKIAAGAGSDPYLWSDGGVGGYQCDSDLYAAHRLFGTPSARRISQAQGGELPPVQRIVMGPDGKPVVTNQFVNITPLQAAVEGRTNMTGNPAAFHDESASGFVPASTFGFVGGLPRPEDTLRTFDWGMGSCGGELVNPRPFAGPRYVPTQMNLVPISEHDSIRAENAARLNRISDVVALQQLKAAGMLQ